MKTTTEADLNHWLREFDVKHFAGRISIWKVVIGDHPDMANGSGGCIVRKERLIYIPTRVLDRPEIEIKSILLHELAHIRGGDYHGKKFRNEIRRFQQEGAPIDKADLADVIYATGKYVRKSIDRSIVEGYTLELAQAEVAEKYGISTDELLRRYPKASKGSPAGVENINTPPPSWQLTDDESEKQQPLVEITFKKFTP